MAIKTPNGKELWTGVVVGRMHMDDITLIDIAEELGWSTTYVSLILNGKRHPVHACTTINNALDRIMEKRQKAYKEEQKRKADERKANRKRKAAEKK